MRISLSPRFGSSAGNVLLVSLVLTGSMGFVLAGYLTLVGGQNQATIRSLAWNSAVPIAESGIEEALTQLHANDTNLVANNNWTLVDGKYYQKWLTIAADRYLAGFFTNIPPVLVSQGFVRLPLSTNTISRTIVVRTRLDALFAKGMVARQNIDINGNFISLDSFDSADPNYSTNGQYDPNKRKDNATIAANSNIFNVGNADIRGKIASGPFGIPNIGPNGTVGDNAWVDGGNHGIQTNHWSNDSNFSFFDVDPPPGGAVPPPSQNPYDYVLANGNYLINTGTFGGKVNVTGSATLLVTTDVKFKGQDSINIQPGASLKLYVSAASASIAGQGVQNDTGNAANFIYYGLPSNTSLSYSGNAGLIGSIYAPNADFTLSGGGNSNIDFAGASVTKSVKMNGHCNFHFDENLMRAGPHRGWIATSWDETTKTWEQIRANNLGPNDL